MFIRWFFISFPHNSQARLSLSESLMVILFRFHWKFKYTHSLLLAGLLCQTDERPNTDVQRVFLINFKQTYTNVRAAAAVWRVRVCDEETNYRYRQSPCQNHQQKRFEKIKMKTKKINRTDWRINFAIFKTQVKFNYSCSSQKDEMRMN